MKIDLPSENWVEVRDKLMAGDKFAVQDAITFNINSEGRAEAISGGMQNWMRNALLTQIITAWSFGEPIPNQHPQVTLAMAKSPIEGIHAAASVIGTVLDIDDYNVVADHVEPLLEKVSFAPNPRRSSV